MAYVMKISIPDLLVFFVAIIFGAKGAYWTGVDNKVYSQNAAAHCVGERLGHIIKKT